MTIKIALMAMATLLAFSPSSSPISRPSTIAVPDSVIVRINADGSQSIGVNGIVIADDGSPGHRISGALTPLELRLPGSRAHAIFRSVDGSELSGEVFRLHEGRQLPHGTIAGGRVLLLYVGEVEVGVASIP